MITILPRSFSGNTDTCPPVTTALFLRFLYTRWIQTQLRSSPFRSERAGFHTVSSNWVETKTPWTLMNLPLHQRQRRVDRCLGVPDSEGPLRVLGCESQLGPRAVALRLRVDGSEGQVDAWASVMVLFSHLMLVDTERQTRFTFTRQICTCSSFIQSDFYEGKREGLRWSL